jgi:hypothetical protein
LYLCSYNLVGSVTDIAAEEWSCYTQWLLSTSAVHRWRSTGGEEEHQRSTRGQGAWVKENVRGAVRGIGTCAKPSLASKKWPLPAFF